MKGAPRARKKFASRAIRAGFDIVERAIRNPDAYPEFMVIVPFDPEMLPRIFTRQRMRVWAELYRTRPQSLTQLAGRLGRNVSRVRQDVMVLENARLARTQKKGNRVRAFAQASGILIAPPK